MIESYALISFILSTFVLTIKKKKRMGQRILTLPFVSLTLINDLEFNIHSIQVCFRIARSGKCDFNFFSSLIIK